jgi:hypothetical protein
MVKYNPCGIFLDIISPKVCYCEKCLSDMKNLGLDTENKDDLWKFAKIVFNKYTEATNAAVRKHSDTATIFHNSGHIPKGDYRSIEANTHLELESLPTAGWGYDHFPLSASYARTIGMEYLGMTGKFHHSWGEFGGFKNKDALKYECADMISIGASMSVGDHLHPLGKIDKSTYNIIGHAFDYADKIEKYSENTKAYSDIAMWSSHNSDADMGCSKMLQIMHLEYDVLEAGDDVSKYNCIVLPDKVVLSSEDKSKIVEFTKNGGKLIVSGDSVFDELGIKNCGSNGFDLDYIQCEIEYNRPHL